MTTLATEREWAAKYLLANGIRIHYRRTGGDGLPLVLCHGFSDDSVCWTEFAKELASEYDVIMPDARGHGLSDPPRAEDSADAQCEDLAGLIHELELDHPVLMGHSMGSATVAWFAARYPDVPKAVILEDPRLIPWPSGAGPHGPSTPESIEKRRRHILEDNNRTHESLLADCIERNPKWTRRECECWAPSKRLYHPDNALPRTGNRPPMEEIVAMITAPTLILKADAKGELREQNEAVAALLPRGRIVHLAGAGHCVRRDRPGESLALVRDFLKSVK